MPRCQCKDPNPICTHCRKIATDRRYVELWHVSPDDVKRWQEGLELTFIEPNKPAKIKAKRTSLPCVYKSEDSALSREVRQAGLNPVRVWYKCSHPDQPLGPLVCTCRGCGSRCRGYTAQSDT